MSPYYGVNAGFIALCCNFVVTAVVSLVTRAPAFSFDEPFSAMAVSESGD